jgi:hypothetical protein
LGKKSYKTIEKDMTDYFFEKDIDELCSGTRLNNSDECPYIKKRLKGSGGFRLYYYIIIKNDCLYLMFVHPKTGSLGSSNITDELKANIYKDVLESIKNNDLYLLSKVENKLTFTKHLK